MTTADGLRVRARPSARVLLLDGQDRLLLFRFEHRRGPLEGRSYWATPGGGLDSGESFEAAARRELREETGLIVEDVGPERWRRVFPLVLPDGEMVEADERFFLVRADATVVHHQGWTALEREVMTEHRWWTLEALRATAEQVWPEDLAERLGGLLSEAPPAVSGAQERRLP